MKKFKLPRKKKKQYKKDIGYLFPIWYDKCDWEWFYFKRRVKVRAMKVILGFKKDGLLDWYLKNYPNDKLAHHYCKEVYNENS